MSVTRERWSRDVLRRTRVRAMSLWIPLTSCHRESGGPSRSSATLARCSHSRGERAQHSCSTIRESRVPTRDGAALLALCSPPRRPSRRAIVADVLSARSQRSVNYVCGPLENRLLLTGLHTIADIYCTCCNANLGWKYVSGHCAGSVSQAGHTLHVDTRMWRVRTRCTCGAVCLLRRRHLRRTKSTRKGRSSWKRPRSANCGVHSPSARWRWRCELAMSVALGRAEHGGCTEGEGAYMWPDWDPQVRPASTGRWCL